METTKKITPELKKEIALLKRKISKLEILRDNFFDEKIQAEKNYKLTFSEVNSLKIKLQNILPD